MIDDIRVRAHHPRPTPRPLPTIQPKPTPEFKTPEQVATVQEQSSIRISEPQKEPEKMKRRKWTRKKKKIILITGLVVVLLAVAGWFAYKHYHHTPTKSASINHSSQPVSDTVASTLTGLPVAPSVNQRPVTGIMIENEIDARPQSGLDQAGVVFEALAEGGITRFLALYQDTQPTYIGPVRSARPYYIQWCLGFDCDYAHVGGSPDALSDITSWNVNDLNQFYNGSAYQRITSRVAPHNVYTSIAALNTLETSKGYTTSTYSGFPRKTAAPLKTPTVTTIALNYGSTDYNASYTYSASSNDYPRSEGGQIMTDVDALGNQTQIAPKVVIAIVVPFSLGALDASNAYYSNYAVDGSGAAYIFQDGGVTVGTWAKTSNTSQITFDNAQSQPIKLIPGQTWISALTSSSDLTYN